MNWRFKESVVSPPTSGAAVRRQEFAELVDSDGNVVFSINKPVSGEISLDLDRVSIGGGQTENFLQLVDSVSILKFGVNPQGKILSDATITAEGTTGAQTINKPSGSVNFAAAATSLVVTNSTVTANSIIIATIQTNDSTMKSVQAVATAGSFTLFANAAATAETKVSFLVIN